MRSIGIIPAGGKSERFGGTVKDLLPLRGEALIRRTVDTLKTSCDHVVVVSNVERIQAHVRTLRSDVSYMVKGDNHPDMFDAMLMVCKAYPADRYFFSMPDTVIPRNAFKNVPQCDFAMGVFSTNTPERFGCIVDGRVINKHKYVTIPAKAWGVLVWSAQVAQSWLDNAFETYTQAINWTIARYGFETFPLAYYYDCASEDDYFNVLHEAHESGLVL